MKRFFSVPEHSTFGDVALLLLRVVVGTAFMFHGYGKITNPFGWMGPDPFAPAPFVALAALSEFGGGLAWIVGLLTPLAALGIGSTMAVAFWFHAFQSGDPFVATALGQASFELALVFLAVAILLIAVGPGRISLDRLIFGRRANQP
jgi:putative oxidoreductase